MTIETPELAPQLLEVTKDRLSSLPPSVKKEFIGQQARVSAKSIMLTENYVVVGVLSGLRTKGLEKTIEKFGEPFPGLLTTRRNGFRCAVEIQGSKRIFFRSNHMIDFDFCFFLGPDSSLIIEELQYRPTLFLRNLHIPLAYVVSFGSEVKLSNCIEYLDDLIIYHIHQFRLLRQSQANV